MESFAKAYVPANLLEKFNNQKALTTYQNIATDADGGSFDPIDAKGILADSVAKYPSYIEDTLQVPVFNSVGTFIDHTGDVTAYMIGEGVAGTEAKPSNTTRTITQKKIMSLAPITNEVLRFGTLADVTSQTLDAMARGISAKKQHLIFAADGTADTTDGGITGVIKSINDVASNTTEYVVSGDWSAITNTDISRIVALVADWADPSKFAWYTHKNNWGYLEALARTLGGNSYLVQTNQRPVPSLFGYPVKFVNQSMPSAQVDDATGLLFGDLSAMCATGSNGQVYVDSSDSFYFDQDTTTLRIIEHMGLTVFQPGTNGASSSIVAVNYDSAS
jgi:HK97 family phage major capsid protein